MKRQIFGVGGNFFVNPWERPLLQEHLLSLTDAETPRICYLGTATGDKPGDIEAFYRAMNKHGVHIRHLNMFAPHTADFEGFLLDHDIIYVNGGATRNLITIWKDWGLDNALRKAWEAGVILSGTSAGSICWFESCITDSLPEKMLPLDCLGFLPGSNCTHYSSRPDRPYEFRHNIARGAIASPGIATDDDVALHYIDTDLHEIVSASPTARAYTVEKDGDRYKETVLVPRFLGEQ